MRFEFTDIERDSQEYMSNFVINNVSADGSAE